MEERPGSAVRPRIASIVLDALDEHDYEGWLVLEQDTAITGEPTVRSGTVLDRSIGFLQHSAPRTQEVNE